jgi:hypothetical protein
MIDESKTSDQTDNSPSKADRSEQKTYILTNLMQINNPKIFLYSERGENAKDDKTHVSKVANLSNSYSYYISVSSAPNSSFYFYCSQMLCYTYKPVLQSIFCPCYSDYQISTTLVTAQ